MYNETIYACRGTEINDIIKKINIFEFKQRFSVSVLSLLEAAKSWIDYQTQNSNDENFSRNLKREKYLFKGEHKLHGFSIPLSFSVHNILLLSELWYGLSVWRSQKILLWLRCSLGKSLACDLASVCVSFVSFHVLPYLEISHWKHAKTPKMNWFWAK